MAKNVLIAGENEELCDLLSNYAEKEGFNVKVICDIHDDEQRIIRECTLFKPDIVFLNGSYADEDDECTHASLMADVYSVVSVKNDPNDLSLLSYPIDMSELAAVFDKHNHDKNGLISFDKSRMTITAEGQEIALELTEYDVLYCLSRNPNRVFSRSQLAYEVSGVDAASGEKIIEDAVTTLKEKIDGLSSQWSLKFLWGVGYKFEVL
jgi:DNA-binding response OmpR family regulator